MCYPHPFLPPPDSEHVALYYYSLNHLDSLIYDIFLNKNKVRRGEEVETHVWQLRSWRLKGGERQEIKGKAPWEVQRYQSIPWRKIKRHFSKRDKGNVGLWNVWWSFVHTFLVTVSNFFMNLYMGGRGSCQEWRRWKDAQEGKRLRCEKFIPQLLHARY